MDQNFKLMYENKNMTEIEKQLLDKLLDTDISKINIHDVSNKKLI